MKIGLGVGMNGRTAVITCVWRENPTEEDREFVQQLLDEMISPGRHPATREHDVVIRPLRTAQVLIGELKARESITTEELLKFRRKTLKFLIELLEDRGYEVYVLKRRPS